MPPSQELPKSERIRRRPDYLRIQGGGQKLHTGSFLVFIARSPVHARRAGITVTSKVGNAVVRNRIKRLVREVYRRRKAAFPDGYDMVFMAKRQAAALDFATADREIERLCVQQLSRF